MGSEVVILRIIIGVAVAVIVGIIFYVAKFPNRREFNELKKEMGKLREENSRLWSDRDNIVSDISDVSKQNKDFRAKVAENYVAKSDLKTLVKGIMADSSGD
jgi:uncharacterized membrane protein YraQ (UPF0718 family)